ncbi:MAG: SRPBCC family protein [Pirellulales bacterium]
MASFSMTKRITAPVETVFEVASDLEHAAETIRGIERIELLTPPPVGIGTRWRETRRMMGREATETLELTAFDRPHRYTVGCHSCGAYMETTFRFTPSGDASGPAATDLALDIRCEARSLFAKLMSPLSNMMFAKMMRSCIASDLDDLARVAESRE